MRELAEFALTECKTTEHDETYLPLRDLVVGLPFDMLRMDIEALIRNELRYFDSDEQRRAFSAARVPVESLVQLWSWGNPDEHTCIVIARDAQTQIVWCAKGFGPEFPWSTQALGERNLGMDCDWHAYLYEAFVTSTMWLIGPPPGLIHMARDERQPK